MSSSINSSPARSFGDPASLTDLENDSEVLEVVLEAATSERVIIDGWLKFRDLKKWKQRWGVVTKLSPAAGNNTGSPPNKLEVVVPKPTRMPYINFVQAFRHSYQGPPRTVTEMAKMAGATWNNLRPEDKEPFVTIAAAQKAKAPAPRKRVPKRLQRRRRLATNSYRARLRSTCSDSSCSCQSFYS